MTHKNRLYVRDRFKAPAAKRTETARNSDQTESKSDLFEHIF